MNKVVGALRAVLRTKMIVLVWCVSECCVALEGTTGGVEIQRNIDAVLALFRNEFNGAQRFYGNFVLLVNRKSTVFFRISLFLQISSIGKIQYVPIVYMLYSLSLT